jgi:hypothetical protein
MLSNTLSVGLQQYRIGPNRAFQLVDAFAPAQRRGLVAFGV